MVVTTDEGVTTITPTAWKWFLGAFVSLWFFPLGLLPAIFCLLTGLGVAQWIRLTFDGIEYRNLWQLKSFRWDEIDHFRATKLKPGPFGGVDTVTFTHLKQKDTLYGKASKFLAGGTHSITAYGVSGPKLASLMTAYKAMNVPGVTHTLLGHGLGADRPAKAPARPFGKPVPAARAAPKRTVSASTPASMGRKVASSGKTPQVQLVTDSRTRRSKTKGWPN